MFDVCICVVLCKFVSGLILWFMGFQMLLLKQVMADMRGIRWISNVTFETSNGRHEGNTVDFKCYF